MTAWALAPRRQWATPGSGNCLAIPRGDCVNLDVVVDRYAIDWEEVPASSVDTIHQCGAGASCYISIGSWEGWRGDKDDFHADVLGEDYDGWPGEKWLDVRQINVLGPIMEARMDVCKEKGFDGVQFDNVDGWQSETGFPVTQQDYVHYAAYLANMAHGKGLSVSWENAAENVPVLEPYMDWYIMEECNEWDECANASPMIEAGKFVGSVEYLPKYQDLAFCENKLQIVSMFKNLALTSYTRACWNDGSPLPPAFYVSTSGDDNNAGSEAAPWRHIQLAVDRAVPGDTIYVKNGVYNEVVIINKSGSAEGGFITLQNYPGHTPVIDGDGLPISGETGLVVVENQAYIKVVGFEIRNLKTGGMFDAFPAGIWIRGYGDHLEIRNNVVHDIENSCDECGAHGIAVYGWDAKASIHDIIIDGNEVYNGKFGWSESLVLNGNVEKFVVSNNIVHDNDNIGIDLIGFEETAPDQAIDRARDGVVVGNLVYNISSFGNPPYGDESSADGIYVDGGTNIVIEGNTVHDTNIGIELASEHGGKNTSFITVRNNFVYSNTQVGIAFGGYDTERGSTENCVIVNNTLYNNATQGDWGAELYIHFDTRNNIVKNNIIYASDARLFIESWSDVMTGNVVDSNLYFAPGGGMNGTWIWKSKTYNTFAAYQSASDNEANGLAATDPLLIDATTGDLHLQAGSPAINRGESLSVAGNLDIDGNARIIGDAIDLGADEVR